MDNSSEYDVNGSENQNPARSEDDTRRGDGPANQQSDETEQGREGVWTYPLDDVTEPEFSHPYASASSSDGSATNDASEVAPNKQSSPDSHQTFSQGSTPKVSYPHGSVPYTKTPKRKAREGRSGRTLVGAVALTAVVAAGVSGGVSYYFAHNSSSTSTAIPVIRQVVGSSNATASASTSSGSLTSLLSKVEPAIVDVTAKGTTTVSNGFFGGGTQAFVSEGTGMIMTSNGYVVTNNHVVAGATKVTVTLFNQSKTYPATVVGTNPTKDVAVLKIEGAPALPTLTFGDSANVAVGDPVVAIGNALGLSGTPTVTTGIVSALGRTITAQSETGATERLYNMLQTDAPINPGNSGGPLINSSGDVIGMNTAAAGSSSSGTSAQNIGFAEPINSVLQVVKSIEAHPNAAGSTTSGKGYLGVAVQTLSASIAGQLGYNSSLSGVLVDNVVAGSPASQAGIVSGDVITSANGTTVTSVTQLVKIIQSQKPGSQISIAWVDPNTGQNHATVTLSSAPVA
jgi:S1-C subfamily serine protease